MDLLVEMLGNVVDAVMVDDVMKNDDKVAGNDDNDDENRR